MKKLKIWDDEAGYQEGATMNEIDILSSLHHENVLSMREYFKENNNICIVTDLLSGGDIVDAVLRRDLYTEADAQLLFFKLFDAIKYLHNIDVVHRDLKPTNILLQNPQDFASVKIVDFGVAKKDEPPSTPVGTPEYRSPELILRLLHYATGTYTRATDLWSAGVVMFSLLDGSIPFDGEGLNDEGCPELCEAILSRELSFDDSAWNVVSDLAKDLVSKLLTRDPRTRITAAEALAHPWFTEPPSILPMTRTKEKLKTLRSLDAIWVDLQSYSCLSASPESRDDIESCTLRRSRHSNALYIQWSFQEMCPSRKILLRFLYIAEVLWAIILDMPQDKLVFEEIRTKFEAIVQQCQSESDKYNAICYFASVTSATYRKASACITILCL